MFYSDFVLSKKGPLARIWLAAHWDKKLTKAQIFETNIESSIEKILKPKVKLALRTSGHLMLGVVRIYSRKTKYLLADCNEAFVKIKMAFRPGMVDLPEDHREAAVNAVTLPEVFHDFDSTMPDLNDVDIEAHFSLNQSRADEITMPEDYVNVPALNTEDGFGISFDASSSGMFSRSVGFDQAMPQTNLFGEELDAFDKQKDEPSTSDINLPAPIDVDVSNNDGFGPGTGGGLFEGGLFEDTPISVPVVDNSLQIHDPHGDNAIPSTSKHGSQPSPMVPSSERPPSMRLNDDDDFDDDHFIPSPGGISSDGSRPPSPIMPIQPPESSVAQDRLVIPSEDNFSGNNEIEGAGPSESQVAAESETNQDKDVLGQNENQQAEQTTLLQNEEESFALAPVDASALKGLPKSKRKRKLIVDEVKNISGEEMKAQLSDTSDVVITLDLAPPTKRLMHWKETGGVEKLFALPSKGIPSTALFKNYQRHLTSRAAPNDDIDDHDGIRNADPEALAMAPPAVPPPSKRGRKRKQPVIDEEPQSVETAVTQELLKKPKTSPVPQESFTENILQNDSIDQLRQIPDEPLPSNDLPVAGENSLQIDTSQMTPFAEASVLEQASVHEQVSMLEQFAQPSVYPENIQQPVTPQISSPPSSKMPQQALDNSLQPMSATLPMSDSIHVPLENNMSINNQDCIMENMGYDERDQDIQQMQNTNLFNFNNEDNDNAPVTPGMHAGAVTPWHDTDYDNPASIGPLEERGVDETVEQFEERLLNKRATHLYNTIKVRISTGVTTTFNDLIFSNPKKQVAQKFYSLLVLKKHRVLELTQNEAYDVILLTKGPNFDDAKL